MPDFKSLRYHMVDTQIARRGVRSKHVLDAMREVPRERFVAEGLEDFAYEDSALPIDESQTISQPYIVAAMLEAAEVKPTDRVLEVGAGSGYAAAVLSRIAKQVFAIERHETLAKLARERLDKLGYGNVCVQAGDGTLGWPDKAPFDAILVAAGGPRIPHALKEQLAVGGKLVMPLGAPGNQTLCKITRTSERDYEGEDIGAVSFVPLIGKEGWPEDGTRAASSCPGPTAIKPWPG